MKIRIEQDPQETLRIEERADEVRIKFSPQSRARVELVTQKSIIRRWDETEA